MVKENLFSVEIENEVFKALTKCSNYIQTNLRSRKARVNEINDMIQALNEADNDFLTELKKRMEDLSGEEIAISFVNFMKEQLMKDSLLVGM